MVITATADLDEAIADLVHSAFGHAGQKCSAASLAIVEASVYDDGRFLRRLADAVRSLRVGPAWDPATSMGPADPAAGGPAARRLDPARAGGALAGRARSRSTSTATCGSPGVKVGVQPGSPFHLTECFGPVLGVMRAADLDEAIRWQNQPAYGLTAGLHALDPAEIDHWRDRVRRRQPVRQPRHHRRHRPPPAVRGLEALGRRPRAPKRAVPTTWPAWAPGRRLPGASGTRLRADCRPGLGSNAGADAIRPAWRCESNVFRYRPLRAVESAGRATGRTRRRGWRAARAAAAAVGARRVATSAVCPRGHGGGRQGALPRRRSPRPTCLAATRRRASGSTTTPVAADPGREVLRWVREQAVSETLHRHGNLTAPARRLSPRPARSRRRRRRL